MLVRILQWYSGIRLWFGVSVWYFAIAFLGFPPYVGSFDSIIFWLVDVPYFSAFAQAIPG